MVPRHPHLYLRGIALLLLVLLSPFTASSKTTATTTTTTTLRGGRATSTLATKDPSRRLLPRASLPWERDATRVKLAPSQLQALLALEREWQAWEWARNDTKAKAWCEAWNSNSEIVVLCDGNGMVTSLNGLDPDVHLARGTLPSDITAFTALHTLEFPWWSVNGNLEMLGNFPRLQYVDLRFTGFYGEIPASIGNATSLEHLDLSGVSIEGRLPSTFSRLTALTYLSLGDPVYLWHEDYTWLNDFQQEDYTDIHSITATMKAHVLQGPMADLSCLAPLTRLQHLALRNLDLTPGPLPPALSALTLLTHLDIQFLRATSLPTWITALSSLKYLDVTGNFDVHRSTPFPTEWTALTGLGSLRAGLNGFTGSIPSTISALTALYDLELYYNNISGTIPAAMANLTLSYLSLFSNMLSGTIPALVSMPLKSLDLSYNHLSGSLPTALCSITDSLKLGHNDLEGPMPACFDRVRGQTDLSFNKLSGPIPVTLSGHALDNLDLTSSGLTCPPDGSECGVRQSNASSFCTICFSFCSSCTPHELSAPTTPPSASQAASQPSHTASPPSPPTTAAIRSMPRAATISLVLVVATAAVLMVLTLGKIRTRKGFSEVPPSQTDIEL
ncbi:unnamed protein product [Closterium sp. NIES-54]